MNAQLSSPSTRLGALALVLLLGGCMAPESESAPASAAAPESANKAEVNEEASGEAAVVAVDKATRAVTLERADGKRMTLICGPEVRNFDGIEVGKRVKAQWRMTLSVRRLGPDEKDTVPSVVAGATRAPVGAEPGAGIAAGLTMTVKVESVDAEKHVVVFTDPNGDRRVVRAARDEGKKFVEGLKAGDRVEIIHREGIALAVE